MLSFKTPQTDNTVYLINLLELRANVLLLPQAVSNGPVGRRKDDFVWPRNTARAMLATVTIIIII